jgi:hypothetical protein
VYTRSGTDAWTRKEYVAPAPAKEREESQFKILSSQAEYRHLGDGKLRDKPVQMYLKTERQTKLNQRTGETAETDYKTKFWIDENGLILKSDFTAENRGKTAHVTTVVIEWELDPSISFTVPEIAP